MRIIQFIVFITIFTTVYMGMHWVAISRFYHYFDLPRDRLFISLVLGLSILFPLSTFLEKVVNNGLTRFMYVSASIFMGFLAISLGFIALYEVVRFVWPHTSRLIPTMVLGAISILTIYGLINGYGFRLREISIPVSGLAEPADIVQMSDIHLGTIHGAGYVQKLVDEIQQHKPVMVLITGDMFDGSAPVRGEMLEPFAQLKMPILMSIGNHEQYEGIPHVEQTLSASSVQLLRNEMRVVEGIQIISIDNPEQEGRRSIPELQEIPLNRDQPAILMFHQPVGMEDAKAAGIDLHLAGHTHHGQMWPFSLIVKLVYPYGFGLYDMDGMWLYTSPGTGTWGPPMRIGSKSEITLIHLVPE